MPIPDENRRNDYVGNNTTPTYSYTFKIFSKNDLRVTETTSGVPSVLTVDVDYTVSGVGDEGGGTITRTGGDLPTGTKLSIVLQPEVKQEDELRNQGPTFRSTIVTILDKLTNRIKGVLGLASRSIKVSENDYPSFSTDLPALSALKYLRINSTKTGLELVSDFIVGLDYLESVTCVSDSNVDISTGGLLTIDDYATSSNDRVLLTAQSAGAENGIYVASSGSWSRASDLNDNSDLISGKQFAVHVINGYSYGGQVWALITRNPNIGVSAQLWQRIALDPNRQFDPILEDTVGTNQNNYSAAGLSEANALSINPTANIEITGIDGGYPGRALLISNASSAYTVTFKHENASSQDINRIQSGLAADDITLAPRRQIVLWYNSTVSRWEWISHTITLASLDDGLITEVKLSTDVQNKLKTNRNNRLVNPEFTRWQRGTSLVYTDGSSISDCWRGLTASGSPRYFQDTGDGTKHCISINRNAAADSQYTGILQKIEGINCKDLDGDSIAFTANVRKDGTSPIIYYAILSWSGTEDAADDDPVTTWGTDSTIVLKANWTKVASGNLSPTTNVWTQLPVITGTPSGHNNLAVMIWSVIDGTAFQTMSISEVMLCSGSTARVYESPDPALLIEQCNRYYQICSAIAPCVATSTEVHTVITFPTEMRVSPTATILDTSITAFFPNVGSSTSSGSTISSSNINTRGARLVIDGYTGLTGQDTGFINQSGTPYVEFDAEI